MKNEKLNLLDFKMNVNKQNLINRKGKKENKEINEEEQIIGSQINSNSNFKSQEIYSILQAYLIYKRSEILKTSCIIIIHTLISYQFSPSPSMEQVTFQESTKHEYSLNSALLTHTKISQFNRARLFTWLSEECSKQRISRFAFVRTCSYIDLYFMKKNDIDIKKYQLFALGALILATKQAEIEGKIPVIDLKLFHAHQLLEMEYKIFVALGFYIQSPIYIESLNDIAKMWDIKCQNNQIKSKVRYFDENKECYLRLKQLYEKMDCLNLFTRVLDYDLSEVVLTLFYLETKALDFDILNNEQINEASMGESMQNPEIKDEFDKKFQDFLIKSEINTKINPKIASILKLMTKEKFPIDGSFPMGGRTFTEILSFQSFNRFGLEFYKKNQAQINRM